MGSVKVNKVAWRQMNKKELGETGIFYGAYKPTNLNSTNLNEAWKPVSAPYNGFTRSVRKVFNEQSERYATVETYGHRFFYKAADGEIPYGTNQQSNPNVYLITSRSSFKGDPGNSLQKYPRVYYDFHNGNNPKQFATTPNNRNKWVGEPEEFEELRVPTDNWFKSFANPYGPGGFVQQVLGQRISQEAREKGKVRSRLAAAPYGWKPSDGEQY